MYYFKAISEEYLVDVLSDKITQLNNGIDIRVVQLRCTKNFRGLAQPGQEFEVTTVVGMEHHTWILEEFIELTAEGIVSQTESTNLSWTI